MQQITMEFQLRFLKKSGIAKKFLLPSSTLYTYFLEKKTHTKTYVEIAIIFYRQFQ